MKIFKTLIFVLILSGIFFVIYRQSDQKGFRRWRLSLKIAVLIAATLAGLVSNNAEAEDFNQVQNTDQQVILVGRDSTGSPSNIPSNIGRQGQRPSNFPTPPSKGRPSQPVYVPKYRIAPKLVDQGLGAGGANPGGGGGGGGAPEFDDPSPVPKKQPAQESTANHNHPNFTQKSTKKKKSNEQCELEEEFQIDKKYGGFAYKLDKNGNPILKVDTKNGSSIFVSYDNALAKYYHQYVYNLEIPKNFDPQKARSLNVKDRIEYLKETVPRDKVIEFQLANAKALSFENLLSVPGFIGPKKEPGTIYINKKTGQVHFVNDGTNTWRTTVIKNQISLRNLAKNDFHLFPTGGK